MTFLSTSVVLLLLSGILLYFYTKTLLENEIKEELYSNKARIERILAKEGHFVDFESILQVKEVEREEGEKLKDTLIYDPSQDEIELFRQLSGTRRINGTLYKITVRAMIIESEDILSAIVLTFLSIILLAFVLLFYLNKSRNKKLWRPFFLNLERLKKFSLKSGKSLQLENSEILEFHELNRELELLTTKIQADYLNLKQFTEDVSHEMQTPLAIMQAKIDTLINDLNISESQFHEFSSLQADIARLKQLNKKLILLARIDNNQFTANERISIAEVFKVIIENFKELSNVEIQLKSEDEIYVEMDRSLAMVLCTNLLSNAVKHNTKEDPVLVILKDFKVKVINSGKEALDHPDQVFERYYKESKRKDSTGLGLSIVKKICDYYDFVPAYIFKTEKNAKHHRGQHVFQINFSPKR